jgi:hypothetical protein
VATTTNFGWTTPDNTGYVKDGALAIRTLGNAVDTSMYKLKGGTTDQVLKKASGTDMDFVWGTVSSTPRIAQVVKAGTTSLTTAGTGYTDVSGLSVTITPTLSTSKILIACSFGMTASNGGANIYWFGVAQLLRGSTSLQAIPAGGYYPIGGGVNTAIYVPTSFNYLDSPATTSATTYKIQAANFFGSPCVVQAGANFGGEVQIVAMEYLV